MKAYYSAADFVIPISVSYARVCGKRFFSNRIWFLLAVLQPGFIELERKSTFILNTYLLAGRESDRMQICSADLLQNARGSAVGFAWLEVGVQSRNWVPWDGNGEAMRVCSALVPDAGASVLTRTPEKETRGRAHSVKRSVQEMCWGAQRLLGWRLAPISDTNLSGQLSWSCARFISTMFKVVNLESELWLMKFAFESAPKREMMSINTTCIIFCGGKRGWGYFWQISPVPSPQFGPFVSHSLQQLCNCGARRYAMERSILSSGWNQSLTSYSLFLWLFLIWITSATWFTVWLCQ